MEPEDKIEEEVNSDNPADNDELYDGVQPMNIVY